MMLVIKAYLDIWDVKDDELAGCIAVVINRVMRIDAPGDSRIVVHETTNHKYGFSCVKYLSQKHPILRRKCMAMDISYLLN
eukprot:3021581-Pleurochrysis_carterae.AAC.2